MHTTRTSTIRRHRLLLVAGALVLGTFGAACGDDDAASRKGWLDGDRPSVDDDLEAEGRDADELASSTTSSVPGAGDAEGQAGSGSVGVATGSGGSTGGGSTSGGTTGGGSAPATPAPIIDAFTTPESIDCHNGNYQPFTASWATRNAVEVTISIDGPGIYDSYGPNGEATLPFTCTSPHTFLLTARGADGQTATKQVTLHPRNVEAQGSDEDPDDEL